MTAPTRHGPTRRQSSHFHPHCPNHVSTDPTADLSPVYEDLDYGPDDFLDDLRSITETRKATGDRGPLDQLGGWRGDPAYDWLVGRDGGAEAARVRARIQQGVELSLMMVADRLEEAGLCVVGGPYDEKPFMRHLFREEAYLAFSRAPRYEAAPWLPLILGDLDSAIL